MWTFLVLWIPIEYRYWWLRYPHRKHDGGWWGSARPGGDRAAFAENQAWQNHNVSWVFPGFFYVNVRISVVTIDNEHLLNTTNGTVFIADMVALKQIHQTFAHIEGLLKFNSIASWFPWSEWKKKKTSSLPLERPWAHF